MPYLFARQNPLDDARNTLSSWDNCMAKSYCKWPVIVGIVVGSLIILSVVMCIARCLCCAAECTICCCKCCTCCCGGGGGRSGHKRMKSDPTPAYPTYGANPHAANPYTQAHAAAPPAPLDARPLNQQYRSHAAPTFTPAPAPERPQFATFDSPSKPVNEDSLPAMPSWGDARDRHVEVEEEPVPQKRGDVELDRLDRNGSTTSGSMTAMAAVGGPRRSPAPARSPVSPIDGYSYDQGFEKEPLVGAGSHRSPRSSPAPYGRSYAQQDDYRRGPPAQNLSPVYGAGEGYRQGQTYGRRSPPQAQPNPYDRYDQRDAYDHQDSYSQAPPSYRTNSPPQNTYNNYNANNASYDNYSTNNTPYDNYGAAPEPVPAPVSAQPLSLTPGYAQQESSSHEPAPSAPPVSAYPGQRSYTPQSSYPGQTTYQAFNPGQTGPQSSGVTRKAVDGSYRDI